MKERMRLNIEQRRIVELEPSGHMLIKGVAGSGKTSIAVRRALFLRDYFCPEEDDNILLVTYNTTLLKYIKYQYEELENQDLVNEQNFFNHQIKADIRNIDGLMYSFFINHQKRHQVSYNIVNSPQNRQILQQAILKINEQYKDIKLLSLKHSSFLLDEIEWIKSCDIPDLETYQEIDRIGRSEGGKGNPQKLTKNSRIREAIYHLMLMYDKFLLHKGLVDFKTMNKLALQEAIEGTYQRYTHIIIDESQDLSKVQLKFINLLHAEKSYSSIMFVADNTQSIYSHSWLGKGRSYASIGYDMSGRARILSKNYRTTTEISKAAYSLIENDEQIKGNVDFVAPSLIDRHGHAPIYQFFMNNKDQATFILQEIAMLQNDYRLGEICIIARNKRLIDDIKIVLEQAQIPCEELKANSPQFSANTVKLTTMHSIKGLEFKIIFLIHLDENVIPTQNHGMIDDEAIDTEERKLLYVGMTRANELLYMSSVRRPSRFLMDINSQYLRFRKDTSLRPFRSIAIQNYQLVDQVVDLNAKEEVIRQWLLSQLENIYGYPTDLITLEYPVQHFSKRGFVDLVVSIEINNKRTPYIFAEIKSFASGIDSGLDQLLSYMNANQDVRYGIVTDGVDIKVIDHNGEDINDIPPCQPQFLPNLKQTQVYIDLRNRETYHYVKDIDDEKQIEIVNPTTELTLDWEVQNQVPLIGNVAAGIPQTAIEKFESAVFLPNEFLLQKEKTYALRVTGDSMIDANIAKDDLVIVQKQETANNGDIVIALINEEAILKEFMVMGGTILLISKNTNYEPIQMDPKDVQINGKVIGVLKK